PLMKKVASAPVPLDRDARAFKEQVVAALNAGVIASVHQTGAPTFYQHVISGPAELEADLRRHPKWDQIALLRDRAKAGRLRTVEQLELNRLLMEGLYRPDILPTTMVRRAIVVGADQLWRLAVLVTALGLFALAC